MENLDIPDEFDIGFVPGTGAEEYDVPESAIVDHGAEGPEPVEDPESGEPEPITAPNDPGEAVAAWVDEAIEASLVAGAGGDGVDNDPPSDRHGATGEFSDDETVLAMPEQERVETMTDLERFAIGGQPYTYNFIRYDDGQRLDLSDNGYKRVVPSDVLAEEGVHYDVEITTVQPSDYETYMIGVQARRIIEVEWPHFDQQGREDGNRRVNGMETKTAAFNSASDSDNVTMTADAVRLIPYGSRAAEADHPLNARVSINTNIPLLRLDEVRGIMRAVRRLNRS